jgi:hypothetical protein
MAISFPRKPRHDTTPLIAVIGVAAVLVAALLVWQNSASQDRYSTLRTAQTTGASQRTDQQQLTCALWALLRDEPDRKITASVRAAADKICSTVPTPTPSSSG